VVATGSGAIAAARDLPAVGGPESGRL